MTFRKIPYYCVLFMVVLSTIFLGCNNVLLEKKSADFSVQITMPRSTTDEEDSPSTWDVEAWVEEEGNSTHLSSQTIETTPGEIKKITFDKIDVDLKVRVCMTLSTEGKVIYKGESDWFMTQPGTNRVSLDLVNAEGKYIVLHYFEDENGEYQLSEVEEKIGVVGELTDADAITRDGYVSPEEKDITQVKITADDTAVVRIYYERDDDQKPEKVTIKYELNDGIFNEENLDTEFVVGSMISSLPKPEKDGYEFAGWYSDKECTISVGDKITITENITLYAKWTPITYTISFDKGVEDDSVNGEMNSISCTYDDPIELPENTFTRKNFDFVGWNTKEDGSGVSYDDKQRVENLSSKQGDVVTLYARWHLQSKVRDVDFSVNEESVNYGTEVTLSCNTEGATIYYKLGNEESFSEYNGENILITSDVTISAYAKKDGMTDAEQITKTYTLKEYTVTLNYNNDTTTTTKEVTSGSTYTLPAEVTRLGYTFDGWELNGEIVTEVTVTDADVELVAKWTPITYTITYNLEGGTEASENPRSYNVESETIELQSPTRTGYSFEGWRNTATGETITQIAKGSTGDIYLTAQWKKIDSSIEIQIIPYADVPFDEDSVTNVDSIISINIPEGYSVVAWEKDGETISDSAGQFRIDVSGWNGGIYTVTIIFTDNAGSLYSQEMQVTINR